MGWFSSKKKRGRRAKQSRWPIASPTQWDPQRTLARLKVLGVISCVACCVVVWYYTERQLSAYASVHGYALTPQRRVELINAPSWMSKMLEMDLSQLVLDQAGGDPMDRHGLERAGAELAANPWVERVDRIWRLAHGRVMVLAQYREPMAVIQGANGYHLVDARGIRLPGLYLNHQLEQLDLPLIVGVTALPSAEGRVWPGGDLQAGLSLQAMLADEPYKDQIRSYDVSGRDTRGRVHLVLHTDGGMVRWGLPPGHEQQIEPDAATKKSRLAWVNRQRGSIDAGGKVVDLFGAAVFVHRSSVEAHNLNTRYTWSR